MLVVIKEIIAALAPIPVIYTAIFTWSRRLRLAERAGERFGVKSSSDDGLGSEEGFAGWDRLDACR